MFFFLIKNYNIYIFLKILEQTITQSWSFPKLDFTYPGQ